MNDPVQLEPERIRKLRRSEYDRLVAAGAFEGERVELLHGRLVEMTAQGTRHSAAVRRLTNLLAPKLTGRALIQVQSPFAAGDDSEPEPDIAVLPPGDYLDDHPKRAWLIIEVADSSVRRDRLVKTEIYALSEVDEYWIVDLDANLVELYSDRSGGQFRQVRTLTRGQSVRIGAFPDVEIPIELMLP